MFEFHTGPLQARQRSIGVHLAKAFDQLRCGGQLGVDEFKVDRMSITLVDELSAIRTSRCALQPWKELACAAFTKSVPCQIVNIINNNKKSS